MEQAKQKLEKVRKKAPPNLKGSEQELTKIKKELEEDLKAMEDTQLKSESLKIKVDDLNEKLVKLLPGLLFFVFEKVEVLMRRINVVQSYSETLRKIISDKTTMNKLK